MKIIYISNYLESDTIDYLFRMSKQSQNFQNQKFHRLMIEGLIYNNIFLEIVSIPPINRKSHKNFFYKFENKRNEKYAIFYLMIINIKFIKNFFLFLFLIIKLYKLKIKKNDMIFIDILNVSAVYSLMIYSVFKKRKKIGIFTDLPSVRPQKINKIYSFISNLLLSNFNKYIFLTNQMKTFLNKKKIDYFILDGLVDYKLKDINFENSENIDKFICHYAGSIDIKYGIDYLVEAFSMIENQNIELHIFGNGNYSSVLKVICEKYKNIKYFGTLDNSLIVKKQLQSQLLINPRYSSGLYNSFSFPSKVMEYFASGTASLITRLPGIPDEYYRYCYIIEEENAVYLKNKIMSLYSSNTKILKNKGLSAKKFVLENKNNYTQTKNIIKFLLE